MVFFFSKIIKGTSACCNAEHLIYYTTSIEHIYREGEDFYMGFCEASLYSITWADAVAVGWNGT